MGKSSKWPPPKQPEFLVDAMIGECRHLALTLAPFLEDQQNTPQISRHAVHMLRQQARKVISLLAYLSPLLPSESCRSMLSALHAVLSGIGPVRDVDVLLSWLQKTLAPQAHPPAETDGTDVLHDDHSAIHRLLRMREKRLAKAIAQIRQHKTDLAAFSDEGTFSCLSLLPSAELEAFHAEQSAILRRDLSKTAASLLRKVEGQKYPNRALHKFRLQVKAVHDVWMTIHDTEKGTDPDSPSFRTLMEALDELRVLLGEWQDTVVGTALLQKASNKLTRKGRQASNPHLQAQAKWKKHVVKVERRMHKHLHALLHPLKRLC